MVEVAEALIASGWCRSKEGASQALAGLPVGVDVLPILAEAARRKQTLAVLDTAMQHGAKLTLGWPGCETRPLERWLGSRLMWWPRGVPDGRKVAWVSSRLGRAIDERPDWFAVLRSATAKLDPARDVLLTAPSTTVDRFLERAAILFGLRRLRVHLDERRSLVDWLTRLRRQLQRNTVSEPLAEQLSNDSDVFVSPIINDVGEPEGASSRTESSGKQRPGAIPLAGSDGMFNPNASGVGERPSDSTHADGVAVKHLAQGRVRDASELPLSDRVLVAAADRVFALQVRPNGNLHRLLRARLSDSAWPAASVWLALGDSLVPQQVAEELQSLGAVGWWLFGADVPNVFESPPSTGTLETCPTISELPWADSEYFVHWTRRRDGPWPGQSDAEFIDDLLLSREASSHSAFAALSRIVQQRRLLASATGIRGDVPVVSLSANPLSELAKQRKFRAHRGRWDCEAYGLCVRRKWLQSRGAKPVIYGNDSQWATLPDSERPFFQLQTTRSRGRAKAIDWTQEAEWRVPQDVDLSEASRDDVVLFVPTEVEARQLSAVSPWRVLVLSLIGDRAQDIARGTR